MENKNRCYTHKEKLLLIELIKENPVVENNKKTDAVSIQEKNEAWRKLCRIFNAQPEVETKREPQQLRKLWNNLKQRKKKESIAARHSMLTSGGCPTPKTVSDPVMDSMEMLDSRWDSSALFECNSDTEIEEPREELASNRESVDQTRKLLPSQLQPSISNNFVPTNCTVMVKEEFPVNESQQASGEDNLTSKAENNKYAFPQKNEDAREQQRELHAIKMEIAREELLKAQYEKETAIFERRRVEAEAELAILKLNAFKNMMK